MILQINFHQSGNRDKQIATKQLFSARPLTNDVICLLNRGVFNTVSMPSEKTTSVLYLYPCLFVRFSNSFLLQIIVCNVVIYYVYMVNQLKPTRLHFFLSLNCKSKTSLLCDSSSSSLTIETDSGGRRDTQASLDSVGQSSDDLSSLEPLCLYPETSAIGSLSSEVFFNVLHLNTNRKRE